MAAITVKCKSCKKVLKFPAAKAGKRTRCPECDELIRIPEADDGPKDAIQAKKPPPPPPAPPPAPAATHSDDDDEEGGSKTYGVVAPLATPTMDDLAPKKQKKDKVDKGALARRVKKRVVHEADKWQKITAVFMLAFVGCCLLGLSWLMAFITYMNGWLFNNTQYSLLAEKLLIQQRGTVQQTGNFDIAIGKKAGKPHQITNEGPPDSLTGHFCKVLPQKWAPGIYNVTVRSVEFDPFVRVEDDAGTILATDDNSGGGKDAQLAVEIPGDGVYNLIVCASMDVPYDIKRNSFLVAVTFGSLEMGRVVLILGTLAALAAAGCFMIGYLMCLGIPDVAGTRALTFGLIGLGGFNLLIVLFLKLLPASGALGYVMAPLLLPELAMAPSNIERLRPLHVFWSYAPFWETFTSILLSALLNGEIVLFCIFMQSVAVGLKDDYLTEKSMGLIKLSFGVLFIYFTYQLISITGTSNVLLSVLRFTFMLYLGFCIGLIIYLAIVLLNSRQTIEKLLEPEEGAEQQEDEDEEDEDEDEEDEDEEDEDDEEEDDDEDEDDDDEDDDD